MFECIQGSYADCDSYIRLELAVQTAAVIVIDLHFPIHVEQVYAADKRYACYEI